MNAVPEQATSTTPLEIRVFGRFEVLRDGTPIPEEAWGRRKAKALLKVLLTDPGHVFSQDQLIEALSEGEGSRNAIATLYSRVSELRRALEPALTRGNESQFVIRRGHGYFFNVDGPCWIDALELEKLLAQGEKLQQAGRHAAVVETLEEAIGLYRGDFLEADHYEEWALAPREVWRRSYATLLRQLGEGYAQIGDLHRAAVSCRAAFDLRPSDETVLRQLMTYLHTLGDRAGALRVYKVGRDALKRELDVVPMAETQALQEQIRRQSPMPEQIAYDRKRIAVLPIVSIGPEPEDEYFADGLTEELIHTLSQIHCLKVIAQTSALSYKNTKKTIAQIGRELSVGTVVEGSIRKEDRTARIVMQLIDVEEETHIWSHEYDRVLEGSLAIQCEIANKVAEALEVEVLEPDKLRAAVRRSDDFEAFTLFLKGRHFLRQDGGLGRAIECYERALERDPDYALAYAGLAEAHCLRATWAPESQAYADAEAAAHKAIALSDDLPEAHTALGLVAWYGNRDPQSAEEEFKKAIALEPRNAEAHHWYGWLLEQLDRPREAILEVLKAHEVDPLSPRFNATLGFMLTLERRYDEAISRFERAVEIDPTHLSARIWLGRARQMAWDWEGAEEAYRQLAKADPENPNAHQWLATILLSMGKAQEARAELARASELAEEPCGRNYNYNQGIGYYFLGDYEQALPFVRRAADGWFTQALWGLAWVLNELGEYEEALAALDKAEETLGGRQWYPRSFQSVWIECNRGVAYARMGEEQKARRQVTLLRQHTGQRSRALCIGLLHFVLGDIDLGFEWLEKAVAEHEGMLMHIKNLPMLEPVRGDPRYLAILEQMGLAL